MLKGLRMSLLLEMICPGEAIAKCTRSRPHEHLSRRDILRNLFFTLVLRDRLVSIVKDSEEWRTKGAARSAAGQKRSDAKPAAHIEGAPLNQTSMRQITSATAK
ncbi:hypothetical protein Q9R34_15535 [Enterobacter sp. BRE11]|nr:hypothetical protein [Enterobacter sp. BRE11]